MTQPKVEKLLTFNKRVKAQTNQRLAVFYDSKIAAAKQIDPGYAALLLDCKKYVLRGGKRLRPTLMLLGYQAAGGADEAAALDAAMALELFHSFVLMHDDVMDGDTRRYGGPNITGMYERRYQKTLDANRARKTAESVAIMAGELHEAFTFEVLSGLQLPATVRFELMDHMNRIMLETAAGQFLDVTLPARKTTSAKVIDKINFYKTAGYTVTSPLQFGVIAAQKKYVLSEKFSRFGRHLGMAFQLKDDLLGMFGSTRATGKPVGSDLREGKRTMLMYTAQKLCSPMQWKLVQSKLGMPNLGVEDIRVVRSILRECGVDAKVTVIAKDHLLQALAELEAMKLEPNVTELLGLFANYCVDRKK